MKYPHPYLGRFMLERLTRNKILQKVCLTEIAKLTSEEVAKIVEWWGCSCAFPSEPKSGNTTEQSESSEDTSGGSSDSPQTAVVRTVSFRQVSLRRGLHLKKNPNRQNQMSNILAGLKLGNLGVS